MSKQRRYLDDNPPTDTINYGNASPYAIAMYNGIDPTGDVPEGIGDALYFYSYVKGKQRRGEEKIKDWKTGNTIGERVADAAWRKRLGIPYDTTYLPTWNGDTIRLPKELEMEIPVDTNFVKNKISNNEKLLKQYGKKTDEYKYIESAIIQDKLTLDALRETYKTGKPVGVNEMSANSRQLIKKGNLVKNYISPLNVLKRFNIRYDKNTNRMYYSDRYDFNQFELGVPGKPFRFRGYVDLNENNKRSIGGSLKPSLKNGGIYIKPSHRGRFTALKERTGHSATWFKENGTPAQKKMATFALNAAKWKH